MSSIGLEKDSKEVARLNVLSAYTILLDTITNVKISEAYYISARGLHERIITLTIS
jgi:hypothetical protein